MKRFIQTHKVLTPLQPRDAFYGGRTEAFTLFKEASMEEEINYYDVTSLYPFINKTGKIPLGHPDIITEQFLPIDNYEGLIRCKVLPPKGLFHPVLPYRVNGKLMFPLCETCATTNQQTPCCHHANDRAFVGMWVTDEVKKAIDKGYKVLDVYEVWHFNEISRYNPTTMMGGLFTEYVNTFLKLKQVVSGWPEWVKCEADKFQYIESYYKKEGIRLAYNNIHKNPGMRALAKLMLNSFWGKFGQRSNMGQVDMVDDASIYFQKLTCDSIDVTTVNFISEEFVKLRWKYKEEFVDTNPKTNVVIAAYTTSQARLKLYTYLEKLGERALYADTDSVVFSTKYDEEKPQLGDYLGDLTDEIPGNSIKTFVTCGPKNYGYELVHPDTYGKRSYCKIRGITLNHRNLLSVNFDTTKRFVTNDQDEKVKIVDAYKISRERNNAKLITMSQNKDNRLVFDKRVRRENFVSFPYGY